MNLEITLRPATMDDAPVLFAWRNDPDTRSQSISQDEVSPIEHVNWLKGSLASQSRTILIAEFEGKPVGTIRLDVQENCDVELSWTIGKEFRGKGFGRIILSKVCENNTHRKLLATIRNQNTASMLMAQKCGFFKKSEADGMTYWERPAGSDSRPRFF